MSQNAERQAWTDFVERGASSASSTKVRTPGRCSVCDLEIPAARIEKNIGTCSPKCGKQAQSEKYGGQKVEFNGRPYDSLREANHAAKLQMLADRGLITDLKYQPRIVLVPGQPPLRAIAYIADFSYRDADDGRLHIVDAKGFKTQVYRLKKRAAALLLGVEIEEV